MVIRTPIKKIGRSTAVYGVGNVFSKLAALFLIPIYTRFLSISEVGILALLEMAELFLVTIVPWGMNFALWRFLSNADEKERKKYITSGFLFTLALNFVILGLIALIYRTPAGFLGLDEDNSGLFLLILLNILFTFSFRYILVLWQYQEKAMGYILLSLAQFVGVLALTILFVVGKGWGLWGVLLAKTLILGLIFIVSSGIILKKYLSMPSISVFLGMLKFGAPMVLFALVIPVLNFSDRFFLKLFVSLDDIGIYSIAYKFGMIINMVLVIPLQRGWMPMMYKMGVEKESHKYYRDILFYYAVFGALVFLGISFFANGLIKMVATPEYLSGVTFVPIITLAYFVNGFRQFFMAGSALNSKNSLLGFASLIGIITNVFLNYFLIKYFGVIGAAWATLISYFLLSTIIYLFSQRLVPINWAWNRLIKLGLIMLTIFIATFYFQSLYSTLVNFIGLIGIILFLISIRIFNVVGRREINGIKSILSSVK